MTKPKSIIDSALKLPREERARVAREIIASLDGPADQDVDAAWLAEVERRLDEVRRADGSYDITYVRLDVLTVRTA